MLASNFPWHNNVRVHKTTVAWFRERKPSKVECFKNNLKLQCHLMSLLSIILADLLPSRMYCIWSPSSSIHHRFTYPNKTASEPHPIHMTKLKCIADCLQITNFIAQIMSNDRNHFMRYKHIPKHKLSVQNNQKFEDMHWTNQTNEVINRRECGC
jgi:hypothetical protein